MAFGGPGGGQGGLLLATTPSFRASANAAAAVENPSATERWLARYACGSTPAAICLPNVRLRDRSPVQVRTRSPTPAIPRKVSGFAPSATPSRVISASPARDERGAHVGPELEPVAGAGGDRHHVLDRAADL